MCYLVTPPDTFSFRYQGTASRRFKEGKAEPQVKAAQAAAMLRARPTQISLNSRDLDWHHVRHDNRQAQRAGGHPVRVVAAQHPNSPSPSQLDEGPLPYGFPHPPIARLSPIRSLQVPTFANREDMEEYWTRIMTNAGGVAQVHSVSSGRPVLMNTSPSSPSEIQASSASFESDEGDPGALSDPEEDDINYTSQMGAFDNDDLEEQPKSDTETHSQTSNASPSSQPKEDHNEQLDSMMIQSPHITRRRHRLPFSFRRQRHQRENTPEPINSLHHPSENTDFDGPSDHYPPRHAHDSGQSTAESQYTTAPNSLHEDTNNAQELSTGFTTLAPNDLEVRHTSEMAEYSFPFKEKSDESTAVSLVLPRQISIVKQHSSGLPKSPLSISQAAASSSPEKRSLPAEEAIELSESLEALSLHPRRAKRYKRRSQSYPYIQSEADTASHGPQNDSSNQDVYNSALSDLPTLRPPFAVDQQSRQLSPQSSNTSLRPVSQLSSEKSFTGSPTRRTLSPLAPPFTPRKTPIQPAPPLALPTHAFSAVRRTVSFASPSTSSSPSPSRAQFTTPPYSFNNFPIGPLHTQPPPRTPQYVIYNDRLPASIQPQTPVGLPSNGIPSGGLPGVNYGGAFTAPVGGESCNLSPRTWKSTNTAISDRSETFARRVKRRRQQRSRFSYATQSGAWWCGAGECEIWTAEGAGVEKASFGWTCCW